MNAQTYNANLLRRTLQANATFSGISGLSLLLGTSFIASFLGVQQFDLANTLLIGTGVSLLLFSIGLFWNSSRKLINLMEVKIAAVMDGLWVLSTILILSLGGIPFSQEGWWAVIMIADLVAVFGFLQYYSLKRMQGSPWQIQRKSGNNMTFEIHREIQAPADVVWEVISDVESYAEIAPNLNKAQILQGQEKGMIRQCEDTKGRKWKEECTLWNEGKEYSMTVDTSDYPYPFAKMQGTWGIEDQGSQGVLLKMKFDFTPKLGLFGKWLLPLMMEKSFAQICEALLTNWENKIKSI